MEVYDLPDEGWRADQAIVFTFRPDSAVVGRGGRHGGGEQEEQWIDLSVRHRNDFPYADLPLEIKGVSPDKRYWIDTIDLPLARLSDNGDLLSEPAYRWTGRAYSNHRDITINEFDTVILASSLIPGNEHGVYKVINKLVQLGARVVNRDNAAVHVSGHCSEGELLYMYNIVKPKNAMPIHGENRHLVANGLIAVKTGIEPENVVLAEDGDVVDLYHGKAAIVGSVPCGYIYVDGDSVGELTDDELEKRRILGSEGFVSCFAVVVTDA